MDEVRISPAGDGFYAASLGSNHRPSEATEETPHACWGGWVFLGFEDEADRRYEEAVRSRGSRRPAGPSIRPEDFGLGVRSPRPEEWLRGQLR